MLQSMQHLRQSFVHFCFVVAAVDVAVAVVVLLSQGRCVRNVFVLSWLSSAKTVEEGTRKGPNIKLTEMLRHHTWHPKVVVAPPPSPPSVYSI
jgi:hypothetical protein